MTTREKFEAFAKRVEEETSLGGDTNFSDFCTLVEAHRDLLGVVEKARDELKIAIDKYDWGTAEFVHDQLFGALEDDS